MPILGKYCKAYPIARFRAFQNWKEPPTLLSGGAVSTQSSTPSPADEHSVSPQYLYLHEDLVVTAGIWANKDIVFDEVTSEWASFCKNELGFDRSAQTSTTGEERLRQSS
jgi:hypothetical protein